MSVHNYFTCDYCNEQAVFDADDGVAVTLGRDRPERWFEVPGKGIDGSLGHACPQCVAMNGSARKDIAERRDAALAALAWGSHGLTASNPPEVQTAVQTFGPTEGAGDRPNG